MALDLSLVLTVAAVAAVARRIAVPVSAPLVAAAALAILYSLATTQAAPTMFSQRRVPQAEEALGAVFARFARWQTVRAAPQVLTLAAVLWALVAWFALA